MRVRMGRGDMVDVVEGDGFGLAGGGLDWSSIAVSLGETLDSYADRMFFLGLNRDFAIGRAMSTSRRSLWDICFWSFSSARSGKTRRVSTFQIVTSPLVGSAWSSFLKSSDRDAIYSSQTRLIFTSLSVAVAGVGVNRARIFCGSRSNRLVSEGSG